MNIIILGTVLFSIVIYFHYIEKPIREHKYDLYLENKFNIKDSFKASASDKMNSEIKNNIELFEKESAKTKYDIKNNLTENEIYENNSSKKINNSNSGAKLEEESFKELEKWIENIVKNENKEED